jgi:predicted ABC-type transport system involved in lysophospholipase L1 biosynthesis ATPase subunit
MEVVDKLNTFNNTIELSHQVLLTHISQLAARCSKSLVVDKFDEAI